MSVPESFALLSHSLLFSLAVPPALAVAVQVRDCQVWVFEGGRLRSGYFASSPSSVLLPHCVVLRGKGKAARLALLPCQMQCVAFALSLSSTPLISFAQFSLISEKNKLETTCPHVAVCECSAVTE